MANSSSQATAESELLSAVQMLVEEVKVLRQVVDELREEVQWGNHNLRVNDPLPSLRRIRSCSLDPTSSDFTVNSVDDATVEHLRAELAADQSVPGKQGELFS